MTAHLIPRPLLLMGSEACNQEVSPNSMLQIDSSMVRRIESKDSNKPDRKQGALLSTYNSLWREKACLRRHRASWASSRGRHSPINFRCPIFNWRMVSINCMSPMGEPNRTALQGSVQCKQGKSAVSSFSVSQLRQTT